MVYPALLQLMRTPRLLVVEWTYATAYLNGLVRFAERRNLVSARVPSHFKRSLAASWCEQQWIRNRLQSCWLCFSCSLSRAETIWEHLATGPGNCVSDRHEDHVCIMAHLPVPVAARCKAWVCSRSPAKIVGSNPAGGMDVCLLWVLCVVS